MRRALCTALSHASIMLQEGQLALLLVQTVTEVGIVECDVSPYGCPQQTTCAIAPATALLCF